MMRVPHLFIASALIFAPAIADAGDMEWRRYVIPSTESQRRHAGLNFQPG
jgi:hypothetical protein